MPPRRRPALARSVDALAELLRVLAEPARLGLLRSLTAGCKTVSTLVEESGLSQPLVSHHLRVLKEAGIARADRRGVFVFYWLADRAVWRTVERCAELAKKLGTGGR